VIYQDSMHAIERYMPYALLGDQMPMNIRDVLRAI
jgi:hypothetical protein